MIRRLAALISLAVAISGTFALSTESDEAKTSRRSSSSAKNHLVPSPPSATPSRVPSAQGMKSTQPMIAHADNASAEKEAKTSRSSISRAGNFLVPPPPPYTPLMPSILGMTNAQAVTADDAVVDGPVKPYSKFVYTRSQGDMPQVAQPNPFVTSHRGAEKRILKKIDDFDSEISTQEKEIDKLLNL